MYTPTEITRCNETGLNTASFDYYTGIAYAKANNLQQTTSFNDIVSGPRFIVCCGDVMVTVQESDFTDIIRRDF